MPGISLYQQINEFSYLSAYIHILFFYNSFFPTQPFQCKFERYTCKIIFFKADHFITQLLSKIIIVMRRLCVQDTPDRFCGWYRKSVVPPSMHCNSVILYSLIQMQWHLSNVRIYLVAYSKIPTQIVEILEHTWRCLLLCMAKFVHKLLRSWNIREGAYCFA